jgi:hypothetical protein
MARYWDINSEVSMMLLALARTMFLALLWLELSRPINARDYSAAFVVPPTICCAVVALNVVVLAAQPNLRGCYREPGANVLLTIGNRCTACEAVCLVLQLMAAVGVSRGLPGFMDRAFAAVTEDAATSTAGSQMDGFDWGGVRDVTAPLWASWSCILAVCLGFWYYKKVASFPMLRSLLDQGPGGRQLSHQGRALVAATRCRRGFFIFNLQAAFVVNRLAVGPEAPGPPWMIVFLPKWVALAATTFIVATAACLLGGARLYTAVVLARQGGAPPEADAMLQFLRQLSRETRALLARYAVRIGTLLPDALALQALARRLDGDASISLVQIFAPAVLSGLLDTFCPCLLWRLATPTAPPGRRSMLFFVNRLNTVHAGSANREEGGGGA